MLLNDDQVVAAMERAKEVVDGLKKVRDQQARDALNLAETLQLRNRQLKNLQDEIMSRLDKAAPGGQHRSFAENIFGVKFDPAKHGPFMDAVFGKRNF